MRSWVVFYRPPNALSRRYAVSLRLARETFTWHKTTLIRFSN
jgi:hypothetical protein